MSEGTVKMSEGQVYDCKFTEKDGVYSIELLDNPSIKSKDDDLEECKLDIYSQIMAWNGDGEAILELLPSIGKKRKDSIQMYSNISADDWIYIVKENRKSVYKDVCHVCQHDKKGNRTDALLELEHKPKTLIARTRGVNPDIEIVKESFLTLLSEEEQSLFTKRPVLYKGKECGYYELFPKEIVNTVGYKDAEYFSGFECQHCHHQRFSIRVNGYDDCPDFVSKLDFTNNYPSMFFIYDGCMKSLTFRNDRWKELKQHKKETKRVSSEPVFVLDSQYVEKPKNLKKFGRVDSLKDIISYIRDTYHYAPISIRTKPELEELRGLILYLMFHNCLDTHQDIAAYFDITMEKLILIGNDENIYLKNKDYIDEYVRNGY